jgi:hypothetical protein
VARIPTTFVDGTSGVILFTEAYATCQGWDMIWGFSALNDRRTSPQIPPSFIGVTGNAPEGPLNQMIPLPQWYPQPNQCDTRLVQSHQVGGILVALGDGSCRVVNENVSQAAWQSAILPNDNINPTDVAGGGW